MKIELAKPLADFHLYLRFTDGTEGEVDLSDFRGRGVFKAWDTADVFEKVAVTGTGAVAWPGEIDLCPDALYQRMTGKTPEEMFPPLQHSVTHA